LQEITLLEERQPCREEIMRSLEHIKLSVSDFPSFIASSLRGYSRLVVTTFGPDVLRTFQMTSDHEILSTAADVVIEFDSPPCQHYLPQSVRSDFDAKVIDLEIAKLLPKRVIGPTGHSHGEIISDIFLRNKIR